MMRLGRLGKKGSGIEPLQHDRKQDGNCKKYRGIR